MEPQASQELQGAGEMLVIEEIKLLLDEKRTALMVMRAGILILLAQLAILAVLIAASRFYVVVEVLHLVIPFAVVNALLLVFAFYLIAHSLWRMRHLDRVLLRLKASGRLVGEYKDL